MTPSPTPSEALRALDRLVGTWEVSGGVQGTVRYSWLEGGFFLKQDFDLGQHGQRGKGLELIGHLRPFGQEASADLHSRIYDSEGNTFEYVYELLGDTLTIWAGHRASGAYYRGQFCEDGHTLEGAWVFPDGGGYRSVSRRVG